jgi:tellurium resistance protein TerD
MSEYSEYSKYLYYRKEQPANAVEQLVNTKEQLANTKEQLANTKEQLANTEEQLVNIEEQPANTEIQYLTVGLGWNRVQAGEYFDINATACMLGEDEKLPADNFFVFYNNLRSLDGACVHTGEDLRGGNSVGDDDEQIRIDLSKISPQITSIVFSASIHDADEKRQNFVQIQNSHIRIFNTDTEEEICKYELSEDFPTETAIEFGRLYLHNGEWKFEATGIGHKNGLQGIVDKYRK